MADERSVQLLQTNSPAGQFQCRTVRQLACIAMAIQDQLNAFVHLMSHRLSAEKHRAGSFTLPAGEQ